MLSRAHEIAAAIPPPLACVCLGPRSPSRYVRSNRPSQRHHAGLYRHLHRRKSKGIYVSRFDAATGRLTSPELAAETPSPSFLAIHPGKRFLYAAGEATNLGGKPVGAVSAFRLDAKTGQLTLLNERLPAVRAPVTWQWTRRGNASSWPTTAAAASPPCRFGRMARWPSPAPSSSIRVRASTRSARQGLTPTSSPPTPQQLRPGLRPRPGSGARLSVLTRARPRSSPTSRPSLP